MAWRGMGMEHWTDGVEVVRCVVVGWQMRFGAISDFCKSTGLSDNIRPIQWSGLELQRDISLVRTLEFSINPNPFVASKHTTPDPAKQQLQNRYPGNIAKHDYRKHPNKTIQFKYGRASSFLMVFNFFVCEIFPRNFCHRLFLPFVSLCRVWSSWYMCLCLCLCACASQLGQNTPDG